METGAGNQVVKLCREYIRRSKAQLEFNLYSAEKDTKKCFYKYIHNKGRTEENLHSVVGGAGGHNSKGKEKG